MAPEKMCDSRPRAEDNCTFAAVMLPGANKGITTFNVPSGLSPYCTVHARASTSCHGTKAKTQPRALAHPLSVTLFATVSRLLLLSPQTDALNAAGVPCAKLDSTLEAHEVFEIYEQVSGTLQAGARLSVASQVYIGGSAHSRTACENLAQILSFRKLKLLSKVYTGVLTLCCLLFCCWVVFLSICPFSCVFSDSYVLCGEEALLLLLRCVYL